MSKRKTKPDTAEISNRLLAAATTDVEKYMERFPMGRDGDDTVTFTPTTWHRLRSVYLAGFAQGSGRGFQEGLLAGRGMR